MATSKEPTTLDDPNKGMIDFMKSDELEHRVPQDDGSTMVIKKYNRGIFVPSTNQLEFTKILFEKDGTRSAEILTMTHPESGVSLPFGVSHIDESMPPQWQSPFFEIMEADLTAIANESKKIYTSENRIEKFVYSNGDAQGSHMKYALNKAGATLEVLNNMTHVAYNFFRTTVKQWWHPKGHHLDHKTWWFFPENISDDSFIRSYFDTDIGQKKETTRISNLMLTHAKGFVTYHLKPEKKSVNFSSFYCRNILNLIPPKAVLRELSKHFPENTLSVGKHLIGSRRTVEEYIHHSLIESYKNSATNSQTAELFSSKHFSSSLLKNDTERDAMFFYLHFQTKENEKERCATALCHFHIPLLEAWLYAVEKLGLLAAEQLWEAMLGQMWITVVGSLLKPGSINHLMTVDVPLDQLIQIILQNLVQEDIPPSTSEEKKKSKENKFMKETLSKTVLTNKGDVTNQEETVLEEEKEEEKTFVNAALPPVIEQKKSKSRSRNKN